MMSVRCEPLALDATPVEMLRRVRDLPRLVALIGSGWTGGEAIIAADPVRELERWDDIDLEPIDGEGFGGGWIGSWGYQLGAEIEPLGDRAFRPSPQPALRVGFYETVLRLVDGRWRIEWLDGADPERVRRLRTAAEGPEARRPFGLAPFVMSPSPDRHRAAVAAAIEHIKAGDIFQANVCSRFDTRLDGDPLDAFCEGVEAMRPAFAAYVADEHGAVASWSPELFLRRKGDHVLSSPIKGTAPLDADPSALVASAKDRAENVMIVDLMRNDVGRVAVPGTVRVPALTRLERHAVWHLVSDVEARIEAPDSALLRATFPPGSVTGAPKVRAMQLLAEELEPTAREAYTGAIGYVSPAAGLELNVVIRTLEVAADGQAWLGVGGGIVADSDPFAELTECFVKAAPIAAALGAELVGRPPATNEPAVRSSAASRVDARAGVFTTVLVVDGEPRHADAHVARLGDSVAELYGHRIEDGLRARLLETAAPLSGRNRLRLEVGPDGRIDVTAAPLGSSPAEWRLGVHRRAGGLGAHKWRDRSALPADVLLVDDDDTVLETDRASFFAVFDDGLHTRPLDGRILPGIARAEILRAAADQGLPVRERPIRLAELAGATEAFAVNALRGIVPVSGIEGVADWPAPGPVTRALRRPAVEPSSLREPAAARLLAIDNYDSFVFNLVQYARELGAEATVLRNDVPLPDLAEFTHLLISPGPGTPAEAGTSAEALHRAVDAGVPVLGVCLGHQVIGEEFGATVRRAGSPVHGQPTLVHHDGSGVLAGVPSPFSAARYHSLVVEDLPDDLLVTARTGAGVVMGLRHRDLPVTGVQFHPESILTRHGHRMLANFLNS